MFNLEAIVRPNILALKPYRCARDDYSSGILLDANENSFGPSVSDRLDGLKNATTYTDNHLERYPDPHQSEIKSMLAKLRGLPSDDHFFLGVGSDESIDMAIRVFCVPAKDKILTCPPTYGMYSVCAQVNDVGVVKVPLNVEGGAFSLNVDAVKEAVIQDPSIKIIFLCSPGNPTGTLLAKEDIRQILTMEEYKGVVLVDEAYIDFCSEDASVASWVLDYPNLIVTQTLSKSFGLAGIRLGVTISSPQMAAIFNKTKAPYNISTPTSILAKSAVSSEGLERMRKHVALIKEERSKLITSLLSIQGIARIIGNNDANFVLAQIVNSCGAPDNQLAFQVYKTLAEEEGVVVRFRGTEFGCEGCLRITVGTVEENQTLIEKLKATLGRLRS
ncbi:histidinol-phosphate transaminase [Blyttiomyces sp. JEL0837]|nr:histidinol-phosphate transaminase [Blyttiomyces sp. JEL0837]